MVMSASEYELEYEYEGEGEWEGESEEFFRQLAGLVQRGVQSPTLRRIASRVGRAARTAALVGRMASMTAHPLPMPAVPVERPVMVDTTGGDLRDRGAIRPPDPEFEEEWEMEWEGEGEEEWESNPMRRAYPGLRGPDGPPNPQARIYPTALMEHLAHAATEAESEAEAEAFIGALVPLAARLIPRIAPTVMRAAPQLIRGLANATRVLRRNPATRPLVRTLPTIMRRTAGTIAQQAARGRTVTPRGAANILARQTQQVMGSPQQCLRAWQHSRALDRRFHRAAAPAGTTMRRSSARPMREY